MEPGISLKYLDSRILVPSGKLEKAFREQTGSICLGSYGAIPGRAIIDPQMPASHDICSLGLVMEAGVAVTLTGAQLTLPPSGGDDAVLSL